MPQSKRFSSLQLRDIISPPPVSHLHPQKLTHLQSSKRRRKLLLPITSGVLIAAGILIAGLPFLPASQLPIQRATATHPTLQRLLPGALKAPSLTPPLAGNWLIIPSINVKEEIWEGKSLDVLWNHEGVWHQTGDPSHNLVLAGHRFQYLPPNTHTFYNLNKLKKGDQITIVWNGISHIYMVTSTKTVDPGDVDILKSSTSPELTIYTCTDLQATRRLVVVATPAVSQSGN